MKKIWIAVTAIVLGCAMTASANFGWGLYGSAWSTADGDDVFGPGFRLTLEMVPAIQLELRASSMNGLTVEKGSSEYDLDLVPIEAGLALNLPLNDKVKFMLGGGPTYTFVDADEALDVSDEIGAYFSAGFELAVGNGAALFAEARYNFLDLGSDINLNGPGANVGLMITW
jgi:hypothetical protein